MQNAILTDILLLLTLTVLLVGLCRRLHMPAIIAYLVAGALIGPHGFAWLTDAAEIHFMAELGIVFLMFMLGLEFSLPVLMGSRAAIFGFGGSQVLLTTGLVSGLGYLVGLPLATAVVVGGAFAMSSTAIVLKQLTEQGEVATRHGRLSVSVLLCQDLVTLPFLVAIPALAGAAGNLAPVLLWTLIKATLVLVLMLLAGRWLIRPIIHAVARAKSHEFFVLATLLLILGSAAIANVAGLSLAIGAFLAGVVLGETPFKHYVEDQIRPFGDVLLGLFFVTIGMQLQVFAIVDSWKLVTVLLVGIIVGKPLLILLLAPFASTHPGVVLRTGICLGQVGEFGLLILTVALGYGLVDATIGQPILASMVLSMMIAPLLIRWNGFGVKRWNFLGYRNNLERQEERAARLSGELENHIIVCGYGRFGQHLVQFLELEGIPYIALDTDGDLVRHARAVHKRVFYGNAGRYTLLKAVGLERARAISITFDDPKMALRIIRQIRPQHPDLPILVRAAHLSDLETLETAGATDALPEALEASVSMAANLLLVLGVPHSRVEEHMHSLRGDQYRSLGDHLPGSDPIDRLVREHPETLRAIRIGNDTLAVGATLQDLEPDSHPVTLISLRRAGIRMPEFNTRTALRPHDILVVAGASSALDSFEALVRAKEPPKGTITKSTGSGPP